MVFQHLAEDSDNEYQMLDATSAYGTSTLLSATAVASRLRSSASALCWCARTLIKKRMYRCRRIRARASLERGYRPIVSEGDWQRDSVAYLSLTALRVGGLSTKIHAICDALGNPTQFYLTSGQAHDLQGADALLPGVEANFFLADKAIDTQARVIDKLQRLFVKRK